MKREAVLALKEKQWITPMPEEDAEFQVCIVPAEASALTGLFGTDAVRGAKELCTRAFVDFKGYENGGGVAVQNTLPARLELFSVLAIRRSIIEALGEQNEAVTRGEGSGGSD